MVSKDTKFFNALGKDYDTKFLNLDHWGPKLIYKTYVDLIIPCIPDLNSMILEIGCGSGVFLRQLYDRGYRNLYGIDLSLNLLRHASKENDKIHYIQGDALELPFKTAFDCIVLQDVLHHIPNREPCIKEINRTLRNGGKLVILDPNKKNPVGEILRWILKRIGLLSISENVIMPEVIKKELMGKGFDIQKEIYFGIISFPLSGIVFGRTILPNSEWLFKKFIEFDKAFISKSISKYLAWKVIIISRK